MRGQDLVLPSALEQVPAGARAHRRKDGLVVLEHREHQHGGVRQSAAIGRVASTPSIAGIWTSITTTSGRVSWASRTASAPVAASATTSTPSSDPSSAPIPRRTTGWSSATRTRIVAASGSMRR